MKTKPKEFTYSKEDIVNIISSKTTFTKSTVRCIIEELGDLIFEILSESTEAESMRIKLFNGVNFVSKYKPETKQVNNINGKEIYTKPKIKPRVAFSRSYCEHLLDD